MSRQRLFDEFPPVPTEAWEEQIQKDLRGADYGELLLWHLPDGLTVRPYYRAEDLAALEEAADEAAEEPVEIPAAWKLRQDIRTPDLDAAARQARTAAGAGVDILGIDLRLEQNRCTGVPVLHYDDFERLLSGIQPSTVELHLEAGAYTSGLLAFYAAYCHAKGLAAGLTLGFDPVAETALSGRRLDHLFDIAADMVEFVAAEELPNARTLFASSRVLHSAGASPIQETALLLSAVSELIVQMMERGVSAEQVFAQLSVGTPVGSSYFLEIARLRALRILLRQLADVFVPASRAPLPPVHGETSFRNRTLYDPHENMLRSTTEAASAVAGGCDVVVVHPFDEVAGRYDEFSYRMARNVQHILRFEGGFGRIADPAAGSYYVEMLTDAVARRSWQLFQDIESDGGFFAALESGSMHERLATTADDSRSSVACRRTILVGTNHYPNADEHRRGELPSSIGIDFSGRNESTLPAASFEEVRTRTASGTGLQALAFDERGSRLADPLPQLRLAEPVEERRLRTEGYDRAIRILLVPFGDSATRNKRSNFAATFLGCGGFLIETTPAVDGADEIMRYAHDNRPDILVYCADDESYTEMLANVEHQRSAASEPLVRGIVASPEVADHLDRSYYDFAVHESSNLLDVIDELHRQLGLASKLISSAGSRS